LFTILKISNIRISKKVHKGNSEILYNKIKSFMKTCKIDKEKCCSKTAYWIKEGAMTKEKIIKHSKYMDNQVLASTIDLKIDQIKTALEKEKIVYISINPDHHFIVYKEKGSDFIDIYQSFISYYDLEQWVDYYYDQQEKHKMTFADFIKLLREFMNFDINKHDKNSETVKKDRNNIDLLFCLGSLKPYFKKRIQNLFYSDEYLLRRYFKQISYSDFPDENSFNFMK